MKVMILVTHLLGTGHLSRALTLARAFDAAGHQVLVASGGMPAPHLNPGELSLVQLPPVRSDGTRFTRLLDAGDQPVDPAYLQHRSGALTQAIAQFSPEVLICELFPFGRRILADEFLAALEAARAQTPPARTYCSVRDILAPPSRPEKAARADAILARWFDGVLIHSDPAATRLEASWPVSAQLQDMLHYTGYVAPPAAGPHPDRTGSGEVLVTAGGGSVGDPLFLAALEAADLAPARRWRLLVGGTDTSDRIAALQARAPGNVIIEATRPDFRQMLYHADASVSMCGYNTSLDLLQAGTPAVLVPFDDGQEVEQTLRSESLAQMDAMQVVPSAQLSGKALNEALNAVLSAPRRPASGLRFDGAAETVRLVETLSGAPG